MHRIYDTLTQVKNRINEAAIKNERNAENITLLAVSKKQSLEKIQAAYDAGQRDFGENYLQEALNKQDTLKLSNSCAHAIWHFIGPIQSNKTRAIAEHFDWVHSIDRLKIAQRLNEQRPSSRGKLNICLQVNIDEEESKAGFKPNELAFAAKEITSFQNLHLRGLMIIPRPRENEAEQRAVFARCRAHMEDIRLNITEITNKFDTLSMGMSGDLEAAVAEGATIVRIGTSLFGQRP